MDITFVSSDLQDTCNSDKLLKKAFGADNARKLRLRLDDMRAAACLFVLYSLPGKCHALKGDRLGAFAVRLAAGYRLVFEPAHDPLPVNAGGTVDPLRVTAVRVVAIEDYHD